LFNTVNKLFGIVQLIAAIWTAHIGGKGSSEMALDHFFFEYWEPKFATAALAGLIEAAAIAA
jgi:hypothetical protein